MLEFIIEVISDIIIWSWSGKLFFWVFSIIFFAFGMYAFQTGEIEIAYWITSFGLLFAIIALLLTAFGKRKEILSNSV